MYCLGVGGEGGGLKFFAKICIRESPLCAQLFLHHSVTVTTDFIWFSILFSSNFSWYKFFFVCRSTTNQNTAKVFGLVPLGGTQVSLFVHQLSFCFVASRSKRTVLFISRPLPLFFFTPLLYPQNVEIIQPNSALPWLAHLLSLGPAAPASRSLSEPRAARAAIQSGARSGDNGSPPAILAGEWIVTLTLCKFWTLGLERLKKLIQGGRKMPQQGRHPP